VQKKITDLFVDTHLTPTRQRYHSGWKVCRIDCGELRRRHTPGFRCADRVLIRYASEGSLEQFRGKLSKLRMCSRRVEDLSG
jgi:hypothetical protein